MLNHVILVGKIAEIGDDYVKISVPRNYKNENGEYDKDIIKCEVMKTLMNNIEEYCKNNDTVGVKGRIENVDNVNVIIVEKLTFLSSKKNEE